jgi:predicted permease
MLLSALGTVLGVLFAEGALGLVARTGAPGLPQALGAGIDGRVLLFAVAVSLLTGVLFALAPLQHVRKSNLHGAIRGAAAATTRAAGAQRFRQALIVGQLALALILLTGTGLMLRTFFNLQRVDAGFDPAGVVTMSLALRESTYADEGARRFWARAEESLEAVPGVASAALTSALPPVVDGFGWTTPIPGYDPDAGGSIRIGAGGYPVVDYYQVVSRSYFATLAIPLIEGRAFDARDSADAPKTAIVNEALARAVWGNASPLGRQIIATIDPVPHTIVGVIADAKNNGLDKAAGTAVYLPYTQVPARTGLLRAPYVAARAASAAVPITAAVRGAVRALDATLPLAEIRMLDEVVAASQSRPRFLALVLTLFAGVALALAAVGIYGVISYSVAQRSKEFGIRMALGAQPSAVLRLEFGRALALTAAGVLLGIAGAYALTRLLLSFLFGVTATDPLTFAGVAALLAAVAMASSYAAARRATSVDPLVALRAE